MGLMKVLGNVADGSNSVTSAIGALKGIGSLFGIGGGMSQEDIMKWQEQQIQKQFDFQSSEAQKNRDFQANQAKISRDWNSINAQLRRAAEAGVNPYALVSQGSYGSAAGSPTPSGSMASGSVSIPSAPPNQGPEAFNLVAQGLAALSNVRSNDVQVDRTKTLLGAELQKLISEGNLNNVMSRVNTIVADNLPEQYEKEFARLQSETDLLIKKGNLTDKEINNLIEEWRQLCYKTEVMQIFGDDFWKQFKALVLQEKGATVKNIQADTTLKGEQALTEGSKREFNHAMSDYYDSAKKSIDLANEIREANKEEEKKALLQSFKATAFYQEKVPEFVKNQLDLLEFKNDWKGINLILDRIEGLANSAANLVGSIKGSGAPDMTTETHEYGTSDKGDYSRTTISTKKRSK